MARSVTTLKFSKIASGVDNFVDRFERHKVLTLAAALAFYTALSLSPLLVILIWFLSLIGFHDQTAFVHQVEMLIGSEAAKALNLVIENTKTGFHLNTVAGVVGFGALLISAASVFGQLQMSLNTIFEVPAPRKIDWSFWLQKRLLSISMVISIGFLSVVSLFVNAAITVISERWTSSLHIPWGETIISFFLFLFFFSFLFKILPDRRLSWNDTLLGGALTAFLFSIGKTLIGVYLGHTSIGSAYGAAGSLIILLLWVYYSSTILLIGAEITSQMLYRAPNELEE